MHIGTHRGPEVGVERRERLVEQDDLGLDGEGAGEGHSLLLAARELVGVAAGQAGQAYGIEQVGHLTAALAAGKPEGDVRSHVEVGEEASFLGHIADPAPLRGDVTAVVVDGGRPPMVTVPLSGRSKPARTLSSVVLPLPDGPSTAVKDPAGTSRWTPVKTRWGPNPLCRLATTTSGGRPEAGPTGARGHAALVARPGSRSKYRPST